ncbi:MAG TPA: stage II sporulation protein M [Chromatiales bacterium]|nr:stage II sporulation protein M [Chromatiales bacterium]
MKQEQFIRAHEADWRRLEAWLAKPDGHAERAPAEEFSALYREACQHLALARARLYSRHLIERLDRLVLQSHQILYGERRNLWKDMAAYVTRGFPAAVRRQWRLVLVAALLFYVPLAGMLTVVQRNPDMVYTVLDSDTLRRLEHMYDPDNREVGRDRKRQSDTDLLMFGFYVKNNTGIGFRTFASGLLFGIGTILVVVFNGLYIGAAAGHLTQLGYAETFWSFVAGHSALELNAIVLSGAAGLRLGLALLSPGRRTRLRALREESRTALQLVYGAAGMFILAAMVEAFWSPATWLPPLSKYVAGIALWVLLLAYFGFGGRRASR